MGGRAGSCLRRNDGGGGRRKTAGGRSVPPTPHLASPLKGGRDEFSWGSCLVRWGSGVGGVRVPACAGMTERGAGMTERVQGWRGGGATVAVARVPACAGMTEWGAQEWRRERGGGNNGVVNTPLGGRRSTAQSVHPFAISHPPTPFPNSSLPPFRGEVRWGVRRPERLPAIVRAPIVLALPPTAAAHLASPIPAPPLRHSCAGRNGGEGG